MDGLSWDWLAWDRLPWDRLPWDGVLVAIAILVVGLLVTRAIRRLRKDMNEQIEQQFDLIRRDICWLAAALNQIEDNTRENGSQDFVDSPGFWLDRR